MKGYSDIECSLLLLIYIVLSRNAFSPSPHTHPSLHSKGCHWLRDKIGNVVRNQQVSKVLPYLSNEKFIFRDANFLLFSFCLEINLGHL